jgi:hypothetical protein
MIARCCFKKSNSGRLHNIHQPAIFLTRKIIWQCVVFRVVDPYSFFTDPDPVPELDVGGQYGSGSNTDPDPDPIRIQGFNNQKLKKKLQLKIF